MTTTSPGGEGVQEAGGPDRVLVVEDDDGISRILRLTFEANLSAAVRVVGRVQDVQSALGSFDPDLVILDLGLPDGDGLQVCRDLRHFSDVPLVVVSATGDEARKIEALDAGADDFLVKPFSVGELLARVRSVWRRAGRHGTAAVAAHGDLVLDRARHVAEVAGQRLALTPKEFDVLASLADRGGAVVSPRELLAEAWGEAYTYEVHYVRNVVAALRTKLADLRSQVAITTERGVGYRLEVASDDPSPG